MWQRVWLAVALGTVLAAPARAQVTLAWKLNQGDKFYLESVQTQKQTMELMGQKIPMNMETTNLFSFEVLKKSADETVLKQTIENVKIKGEGPAAQAQEQVAEKIKGSVFTLTLGPKGRITKVEGLDAYINKAAGDNPLVGQMLKVMLTEEALTQAYSEIFSFAPDKPVTKGDAWKRDSALSLGPMGKFKIEQEYTYEGPAEGGERVTSKGAFKFEPSKGDGGGLPFKVTKGDFQTLEAKGEFLFDPKAGRPVRYTYKARLKGDMTLDAGGNEVAMTMDLDQETRTRLLDKPPAP
jgi:hypothetical protein